MVSLWLCGCLAAEAILLLTAAALAIGSLGLGAVAAAAAGLPVLSAVVVAASYAIARAYAAARDEPGGRRSWRCAIDEMLALFLVFVVIQPFERLWMGGDAVGPLAPGRMPVLLVHGYTCNRGLWRRMRRELRVRYALATINLEPPLAGIDRLAEQLGVRIEALLAETGATQVLLVTHSMGALVSRAYLQRHGASRVGAMVTIAAPHHGTQIAQFGCGRNARQMRPDSQWLASLNAAPPPLPTTNIWSLDDEIVVPADSSRLAGARERVVSGIGHIAMVFSPKVLALVEGELRRYSPP